MEMTLWDSHATVASVEDFTETRICPQLPSRCGHVVGMPFPAKNREEFKEEECRRRHPGVIQR